MCASFARCVLAWVQTRSTTDGHARKSHQLDPGRVVAPPRHTRRHDPSRRAVRSFVRLLSRSVGMGPTRVPSCAIPRARVGRPVAAWPSSPPAAPGCPGIDRLPSRSRESAHRITHWPTIYVGASCQFLARLRRRPLFGRSRDDPSPSGLEQRPADGVSGCRWAAHNPHAARGHANLPRRSGRGRSMHASISWTSPPDPLPAARPPPCRRIACNRRPKLPGAASLPRQTGP